MVDCSQDDVGSSPPTKVPDIRSKTETIRVLFVEDDELYREALADELSGHGFTVESFPDAMSAIAREKQLKGWRREKKVRLIKSINPRWLDLSDTWYDHRK